MNEYSPTLSFKSEIPRFPISPIRNEIFVVKSVSSCKNSIEHYASSVGAKYCSELDVTPTVLFSKDNRKIFYN